MTYVLGRAVVQCANESLLLDAALKLAGRRGVSPGTYLDVRRRAVSSLLFDMETVVRESLTAASCNLLSWDPSLVPIVPAGDVIVCGDVIAVQTGRDDA